MSEHRRAIKDDRQGLLPGEAVHTTTDAGTEETLAQRTPYNHVPSDEELVAIVRRPGLSLRELCEEVWPTVPWRRPLEEGDSVTETIYEWQVPPRPGSAGNRVERLSAAAWLRDQMQALVVQGFFRFGPLRKDEADREAQVSYIAPIRGRPPRLVSRLGRRSPLPTVLMITALLRPAGADPVRQVDLVIQGRLALAEGDVAQAQQLCTKALRGRWRPEALTCLGEVEFRLGHYRATVKFGERALQLRGFMAVHLLLAEAWSKLGNCTLAVPHFRQVFLVDPEHHAALRGLAACTMPAVVRTVRRP